MEMQRLGKFCGTVLPLAAALALTFHSSLRAENIWEKRGAGAQSASQGKLAISDETEVSPTNFFIPEKLGTIREIWAPPEPPAADPAKQPGASLEPSLVVLIQDAHCNVEAQTNISEMLDYMIKTYHFDFVAVEGYEGYYDTSKVHALPDKKLKNEILDYFFQRGRVTGVEYLALVDVPKFEIFGIERKEAYIENYNAFLASIKLRPAAEQFVQDARSKLNTVIEKTFSPDEKKFIETIQSYAAGQIETSQYTVFLAEQAKKQGLTLGEADYKNFLLFAAIMDLEKKTQKDQISTEQEALLKAAQQKLSAIDNEQLVKISLQFKTGRASSTKYYGTIAQMCQKINLDMAAYPNLRNFMQIVQMQFKLNLKELVLECDRLNEQIASKLLADKGKNEIFHLLRELKILSNLYMLELTREEWYHYRDNKDKIKTTFNASIALEIGGTTFPVKCLALPDTQPAETFYLAALKRDKILEGNASLEAKLKKKGFYIVVCGGFHTDGFVEEFRSKKIPYAVVTPLITQHQAKDYYMEVMTSMKTDLEQGWK